VWITYFYKSKHGPEAVKKNITLVLPVAAISHYSVMGFYTNAIWPKLDRS